MKVRIKVRDINKSIDYAFFALAFFLQAFVDGYYIAYGEEPTILKILKYGLVLGGICYGLMRIRKKRQCVFLKEMSRVIFAISTMLIVSLILILIRNTGDVVFCLELVMRYTMSIVYAFVLLNIFTFDDIYNLMVYFLIVSLFGWILQVGDNLLDASIYSAISFEKSFSPFESHYFAPSAINCCAFFLYYKKNKWTQIVSFLFSLLTFKRLQIVFALGLLLLSMWSNRDRKVRKYTVALLCVGILVLTLGYSTVLQPEFEWLVQKVTGQTASEFTSGRSTMLRILLNSGYKMGGLGTTEAVLGRGVEMELISIMLEMSFPVLMIFVFCYFSVAGRKTYSVFYMLYLMMLLMTGSGLYNVFLWTIAFVFFGTVNYLPTESYVVRHRKIRVKI